MERKIEKNTRAIIFLMERIRLVEMNAIMVV